MNKDILLKTIMVVGDVTADWNIITEAFQTGNGKDNEDFNVICGQPGGALLLSEFIDQIIDSVNKSVTNDSNKWCIKKINSCEKGLNPDDDRFNKTFTSWAKFTENKGDKKKTVWRVKEFLGIQKSQSACESYDKSLLDCDADIVVIYDDNLDVRYNKSLWPKIISQPDTCKKPIVILKMSEPIAHGDLWEHLHTHFSENLIVIIDVDDIRKAEVQISRELSWEKTAQDTAREMVYNPAINLLADCRNVVVTFKHAGAVLFTNNSETDSVQDAIKTPECELFFDPKIIEGMWEKDYEGLMAGYSMCMTAAVTAQLMYTESDIDKGIKAGLSAMRMLLKKGYEEVTLNKRRHISFPTSLICDEIIKTKQDVFAKTSVRYPKVLYDVNKSGTYSNRKEDEIWTILKEQSDTNLNKLAYDIVEKGSEAVLKNVPLGKFEKMLTVDRNEIEGFRSIRSLINEYCAKKQSDKPLSIAVFGPPGSGKSFGVKQIANSLTYKIQEITFNLSQMRSADELISAYHQIRDIVLKGIIPLVFWDEFDSKHNGVELGWLRYFLSPMQDGEFMEGQVSHPIGKAVFVFAGGTCHTFQKFVENDSESFVESKGPDFASRLRGYVNILGANPPGKDEGYDPYFIIRRAILLRSVFERNAPDSMFYTKDGIKLFNIDTGVLRAFLFINKYYHGVRSMEAIVNMSMLTGRHKYERSSLPSGAQLNVHVNGNEFLEVANAIVLEGDILEKLAEANHTVFCQGLKNNGYIYGEIRCHTGPVKTHPLLIPYSDLPEYYKESNRENVRDIPAKLAKIGCIMTMKSKNRVSYKLRDYDVERLAMLEHDRYVKHAIDTGWHYESGKDKAFPVDPTLLPWRKMTREELDICYPGMAKSMGIDELPEEEKNKDREFVKKIPEIIETVGYVVKLDG